MSRFYPTPEGRELFAANGDIQRLLLLEILDAGGRIVRTVLPEQYPWKRYLETHGEHALPLFAITPQGEVLIFSARHKIVPQKGWTLLSLASPTKPYHPNDRERSG